MFGIRTSWEKLKWAAAVFDGLLITVFLLVFSVYAGAQIKPDLSRPFKNCRVYGANNGTSQIIASDNELNLILQTGNNKFISINLKTKLENWVARNGGTIEPNPLTDENSLIFITSVQDNKGIKSFFLNSLSTKTGITNWQQKLGVYSKANLLKTPHESLIFLTTEDNTLITAYKKDGLINWSKNYPSVILSINVLPDKRIGILTEKTLYRTSAQTGSTQEKFDLENQGISESLIDEDYIILGFSTGEIIKLQPMRLKTRTTWKIKIGGSISGLIKIRDDILVTSLDNFIYLLSIENGNLRWKRRVSGRINKEPLITGGLAIIVNENNSNAVVINLEDGKIVNQIEIEDENRFSGRPLILGNYLIFQTYKGVFFFTNGSENC